MAEYGAFVKPAKKNRDGFWHTKVPSIGSTHEEDSNSAEIFFPSPSSAPNRPGLNAARALLLVYIGKGYARRRREVFMSDFSWLRGQTSEQQACM